MSSTRVVSNFTTPNANQSTLYLKKKPKQKFDSSSNAGAANLDWYKQKGQKAVWIAKLRFDVKSVPQTHGTHTHWR